MKIQQLSVLLENKPGYLHKACRVLAEAGINVETMALADKEEFGILRILVKETEEAIKVFEKYGFLVKGTEVIAARLPNRPGGLADLLQVMANTNLNVEYMYGFDTYNKGGAIIVLRFDDPEYALELLEKNGIEIIGPDKLFEDK